MREVVRHRISEYLSPFLSTLRANPETAVFQEAVEGIGSIRFPQLESEPRCDDFLFYSFPYQCSYFSILALEGFALTIILLEVFMFFFLYVYVFRCGKYFLRLLADRSSWPEGFQVRKISFSFFNFFFLQSLIFSPYLCVEYLYLFSYDDFFFFWMSQFSVHCIPSFLSYELLSLHKSPPLFVSFIYCLLSAPHFDCCPILKGSSFARFFARFSRIILCSIDGSSIGTFCSFVALARLLECPNWGVCILKSFRRVFAVLADSFVFPRKCSHARAHFSLVLFFHFESYRYPLFPQFWFEMLDNSLCINDMIGPVCFVFFFSVRRFYVAIWRWIVLHFSLLTKWSRFLVLYSSIFVLCRPKIFLLLKQLQCMFFFYFYFLLLSLYLSLVYYYYYHDFYSTLFFVYHNYLLCGFRFLSTCLSRFCFHFFRLAFLISIMFSFAYLWICRLFSLGVDCEGVINRLLASGAILPLVGISLQSHEQFPKVHFFFVSSQIYFRSSRCKLSRSTKTKDSFYLSVVVLSYFFPC